VVLLPGEEMESGFSLFCQSLGVITRGDFKVEAPEFSALVLVLDAKVGDRNHTRQFLKLVRAVANTSRSTDTSIQIELAPSTSALAQIRWSNM